MIMSITEPANTPNPLNSSSDTLRLELKAWEKEFAIAHQGRKAGREDIKQHPEIGNEISLMSSLFFLIHFGLIRIIINTNLGVGVSQRRNINSTRNSGPQ